MKLESQSAPFHCLPTELLSYIFESVPSSFPTTNPAASVSPIFALSEVCRLWRQTALASSELWANICVRPPVDCDLDRATSVMWRIVKTCMERSAGRPLTLTIDHRLDQHTVIENLQKSGASADRIAEINAFSHTMNGMLWATALGPFELRSLRRVCLTCSPEGMTGPNRPSRLHATQFNLPLLEHFDMDVVILDQFMYRYDLPYQFLTHLKVDIHDGYLICTFLNWTVLGLSSRLQNLEICASFSICSQEAFPLPPKKRELHSLKSLSIFAPSTTTWYLLHKFEFASLDHLHLSGLWEPSESSNATALSFQRFLEHCPILQSVSTRRVDFDITLKLVQMCRPRTVAIAHSFSGNNEMTRAVCQLVEDTVMGKEPVACVRELTLHDLTRRTIPGSLFLKDVVDTIEGLAAVSGGGGDERKRSQTAIVIRAPVLHRPETYDFPCYLSKRSQPLEL